MPEYIKELPGYRVRRTRRGFCVIEANYDCIPRTEAWVRQQQLALGMRRWRREYERDRTVGGESAFFPEFNIDVHVRRILGLLPQTVFRGWDFGRRNPACVWLQYSPKSNRIWFLREVIPSGLGIYSLRDLVLYLSGQLHRSMLEKRPDAFRYLQWIEKERDFLGQEMPKGPWFEDCQFADFAGHEATIDRSGILELEHEHKTYSDVLRDGGIQLFSHYGRVAARITLMRQMLNAREDGNPGAYFDPACPTLIKAMAGALSFRKGTKLNPAPEEPVNAPKFTDVFDAASYPLPSLVQIHEEGIKPTPEAEQHAVLRGTDWRVPPDEPTQGDGIDSGLLKAWG